MIPIIVSRTLALKKFSEFCANCTISDRFLKEFLDSNFGADLGTFEVTERGSETGDALLKHLRISGRK